MKVFVNNNGLVDFETPIFMTDEQFQTFSEGMNNVFGNITIHKIEELEKTMGDIERHPKEWKPEELVHLLSDKSHEEVAKTLGREYFSVKSKRGVWILPFKNWAEKNGYIKSGHYPNLRKAIEDYERTEH